MVANWIWYFFKNFSFFYIIFYLGFAFGSDGNQYIGGSWLAGVDFLEDNRYHLWYDYFF